MQRCFTSSCMRHVSFPPFTSLYYSLLSWFHRLFWTLKKLKSALSCIPIHCLTKECHKYVDADFRVGAEIISDWALSLVNYGYAADAFPLLTFRCIQWSMMIMMIMTLHVQLINILLFSSSGLNPEMCKCIISSRRTNTKWMMKYWFLCHGWKLNENYNFSLNTSCLLHYAIVVFPTVKQGPNTQIVSSKSLNMKSFSTFILKSTF